MAYKTPEALADEFAKDWNAALNPCVTCLLARCHPERVDELRDLIDAALSELPQPPYSPVQMRRGMEKIKPIADRVMESLEAEGWGEDMRREYLAKPLHERLRAKAAFRWLNFKLFVIYRLTYPFRKKAWE